MRQARVLVLGLLLMLPALSPADTEFPEDQVSFQVEAGQDVENDRAIAMLAVTVENRDPAQLAGQINDSMGWAAAQLKEYPAIQGQSGSYQTFPVYDDGRIVRWRGSQTLRLESADVAQLSRVVGLLQTRLQVQSLQFSVSPERRQAAEAALIEDALAGFKARAQLIRKSLDAESYRLMDVNVHTGHVPPPVRHRAESMAVSKTQVAAPVLEQGTTRISVQVSGRIQLLRD